MGIDATFRFPEEGGKTMDDTELPGKIEIENFLNDIPDVKSVNASLPEKGISIVVIGIDKGTGSLPSQLVKNMVKNEFLKRIKFIVFVDSGLPVENLFTVLWYVTGNIDPKRDCKIIVAENETEVNHLIVDGTRKTAISDGFGRDWPNPVVSSMETIQRVDLLWPELGLGHMITSPSLTYYPLKKGEGAISVSE
jgi:4-hydroxy-3-polyprenylbenzoate decarboxylase